MSYTTSFESKFEQIDMSLFEAVVITILQPYSWCGGTVNIRQFTKVRNIKLYKFIITKNSKIVKNAI